MGSRVGLIGVGAMGAALLGRLHLAGHTVQAYDIAQDRLDLAAQQGAQPVRSIADAARGADFIHLFVRTDKELTAATVGAGGVLAAAAPGTVVFLHSTVLPEISRAIATAARAVSIRILDAPVTGVPRIVGEGQAVFLVGGADEDAALALPHLQALGRAACHFGPVGSGNVAKLAKNLINANERIALAEVVSLVEASGLQLEPFLEMAAMVDKGSTVSRWRQIFAMDGNHAAPKPSDNLYEKDVQLAADLARALAVAAPMTQAAAVTARAWVQGWGKVPL